MENGLTRSTHMENFQPKKKNSQLKVNFLLFTLYLSIYVFIYSFHSFNFLLFRCCFSVFLFYHQITFRNILSLKTFLSKCHTICVMRDSRQFLTKKQEEKKNKSLFYSIAVICMCICIIYSIFI